MLLMFGSIKKISERIYGDKNGYGKGTKSNGCDGLPTIIALVDTTDTLLSLKSNAVESFRRRVRHLPSIYSIDLMIPQS